ncbi:flavodoxin [Streptomyces sp. KL116D]|uniref:flavodoxin n=1 Tax=Streptomyces sp. KL116D TaxID=3045152 RepID=UPI003558FFF1
MAAADLVGFGSGVFYGRLHPRLTAFVRALPDGRGRAFVFATSGPPELPLMPLARPAARLLAGKVRGDGVALLVPGLRHVRAPSRSSAVSARRPGDADLAAARAFAERL